MEIENKGKVSVIVPVWNAHDYIGKCVDSIINQTYKNIEILLVDDGSTDDSLQICKEYEKKDERVRVFHKKNGGQGSARNLGLDNCTGEYIGFVDNDDWIFPTMYERLVELINKYGANVARCDDLSDETQINALHNVEETTCGDEQYRKLIYCDIWGGHVTDRLFRREVIGDNRFPHSKTIEDMRFMRLILSNINMEAHTNEMLYFYTVRQNNTSFVYARTFVNSYERAEEYQSRYIEACVKWPEYKELLLTKSTTFACGSIRILLKENKKNTDEYKKMIQFLKKYKNEILQNKNISIKYKLFVLLVR